MARYVPSGKVSGGGLVTFLTMAFATGAALGIGIHYVGRALYLILLFPIFWGFVLGAASKYGVVTGKVRSLVLVILVGVLAPSASYVVYHRFENMHLREQLKEFLRKEGVPADQVDDVYEHALIVNYGHGGMRGELAYRAEMGMNIKKAGSSRTDEKPMITGTGMYVYWLVELAVLIGCCIFVPLGAVKEPFCERCEEWYVSKGVGFLADGKVEETKQAVAGRDAKAFSACVAAEPTMFVLLFGHCPRCEEADVRFQAESVSVDAKGNQHRKIVVDDMIEPAHAKAFGAAVQTVVEAGAKAAREAAEKAAAAGAAPVDPAKTGGPAAPPADPARSG